MKQPDVTINVLMEMCVRNCRMCMASCAPVSDMFSISEQKHCAI